MLHLPRATQFARDGSGVRGGLLCVVGVVHTCAIVMPCSMPRTANGAPARDGWRTAWHLTARERDAGKPDTAGKTERRTCCGHGPLTRPPRPVEAAVTLAAAPLNGLPDAIANPVESAGSDRLGEERPLAEHRLVARNCSRYQRAALTGCDWLAGGRRQQASSGGAARAGGRPSERARQRGQAAM
eukprot:7041679-Prymnesium_polylepis.1